MKYWNKIVDHARDVAQRLGTNKNDICLGYCGVPCLVYEDDVLKIVVTTSAIKALGGQSDDAGLVEIIRKQNNNPCIMSGADNKYVRSHGEFKHIEAHFFGL